MSLVAILSAWPKKHRRQLGSLIRRILRGNLEGSEVKRLVGRTDTFRVTRGKWRVIFRVDGLDVCIVAAERKM